MSTARLASSAVLGLSATVALALFFVIHGTALKYASFAGVGLLGGWLAQRTFHRLVTPAERLRDLEERARDSDG